MKLNKILFIISVFVSSEVTADNINFNTDSLDSKQRSIVTSSAFTAEGNLQGLKQALIEGLDAGLTINEIKEELVHLSAYCCFPRSLNGINTFNAVVTERKSKGIADPEGQQPSKVAEVNKYQTGKKVLESLTGRPETGEKPGYAAFVPAIDTLLKEQLAALLSIIEVKIGKNEAYAGKEVLARLLAAQR